VFDNAWIFIIQDYFNASGISASSFGSIGVPSAGDTVSSGSIIATPEPGGLVLLGLGGLAMAAFRREWGRRVRCEAEAASARASRTSGKSRSEDARCD
jgi:hypothetical protein